MTLLGSYGFDEADTSACVDGSGRGNSLTLTGTNAIKAADGQYGQALTKNGTTMPVLPSALFSATQTTHRTIAMHAKGTGTTWYIRWQVDSINSGGWGILLISGSVGIQARNASTLARPTATAPADGLWHHYAGTYDGSTVRLYLDGALANSAALTGPLRSDANRADLMEWTTNTTLIDNVRMYDEALSQPDIAALAATPVGAEGHFFALL